MANLDREAEGIRGQTGIERAAGIYPVGQTLKMACVGNALSFRRHLMSNPTPRMVRISWISVRTWRSSRSRDAAGREEQTSEAVSASSRLLCFSSLTTVQCIICCLSILNMLF